MCVCKAGYTGKYCQQETTFRLDGTYSVHYDMLSSRITPIHHIAEFPNYKFNLKFDFRVNTFDEGQIAVPLIYFEQARNASSALFLEIVLHKEFLSVQNSEWGLDEKMAFFYADSADNKNIWHSIEFLLINEHTLYLTYAVKELHLSLTKMVNLSRRKTLDFTIPEVNAFTIGQFYVEDAVFRDDSSSFTNQNYLSGACVRDVTLNGLYLFKNTVDKNPFSVPSQSDHGIKYGCGYVANQCVAPAAQFVEAFSIEAERQQKPTCLNNSTCLYKLYNYECVGCRLPFYGKNCHYGKAH